MNHLISDEDLERVWQYISASGFPIAAGEIVYRTKNNTIGFRERLSELEHIQWAYWTEYMLDNMTPENIDRWRIQIKTAYKDLSEKEKDSDRKWSDLVLKEIGTDSIPETQRQVIDRVLDDLDKRCKEQTNWAYDQWTLKKMSDWIEEIRKDVNDGRF